MIGIEVRPRAPGSVIEPPPAVIDAVDLWLERVDLQHDVAGLAEQLDAVEAARAERFRFPRDRDRFIARRAFLRRVLAGYAGVAPAGIRYRVSANGRPELESMPGITFSASHSAGLAVVAVGRGRLVGVDLERLRPMPDALDLAVQFCSPGEYADLESLPDEVRSSAFLRLWTRKEAYVKALGVGLSKRLADVHVGGPDQRPRHMPGYPAPFVFRAIDGIAGYVGAVAASGSSVTVRRVYAAGLSA